MKKMISFLLASVLVAPAMAKQYRGNQQEREWNKDKEVVFTGNHDKKGYDRYDSRYSFSKREMELKIAQINREYDYKIKSVKSKFFMSRFKKEMMIRQLEDQRRDEIRQVYAKFSDRRNRFGDNVPRRHF